MIAGPENPPYPPLQKGEQFLKRDGYRRGRRKGFITGLERICRQGHRERRKENGGTAPVLRQNKVLPKPIT